MKFKYDIINYKLSNKILNKKYWTQKYLHKMHEKSQKSKMKYLNNK